MENELVTAAKNMLKMFERGHAIDHFNWGASALRAEDFRELNELPGQLRKAVENFGAAESQCVSALRFYMPIIETLLPEIDPLPGRLALEKNETRHNNSVV